MIPTLFLFGYSAIASLVYAYKFGYGEGMDATDEVFAFLSGWGMLASAGVLILKMAEIGLFYEVR